MFVIEELRPRTHQLIKNLISAAGLDTREWKKPANPKFCYEWSFVESDKIVVNLAYRGIVVEGGKVLQTIDLPALKRDYADGNAARMRRLDRLARALDLAYRRELPIQRTRIGCGAVGGDELRLGRGDLYTNAWGVTGKVC